MSTARFSRRLGAASLALATAASLMYITGTSTDTAHAAGAGSNLSLGATATASGQELAGRWGPALVVDGVKDPGSPGATQSRWSSNTSDSAHITVKLAAPAVIDHVAIEWEQACAAKYKIQVSNDGVTFIDATGVLTPVCGTRDIQPLPLLDGTTAYQHVRMQGIERTPIGGQKYGISLWELEVWDGPEPVVVTDTADNLIPLPQNIEQDDAAAPFVLSADARIVTAPTLRPSAEFLAKLLRTSTGFDLPVVDGAASDGDIVFAEGAVAGYANEDEAYAISTSEDRVTITSPSDHGAFNATQTLRQLFPAYVEAGAPVHTAWTVPVVEISDAPRFEYRGVMLDVARSFLTVEEVKEFLDSVAAYKISRLHFHIADDQGWRLEISNDNKAPGDPIDYSLLTEISGATAMTNWGHQNELGRTGYYTQDEYSEIVQYAADLHIEVVPEIDTPGHTNAALHAIKELNSAGSRPAVDESGRVPFNGTGAVGYSSLDANSEVTWVFLRHVLTQLAALTPGEYIHVGGDESMATSHADYVKFITKSVELVHDLDKKMIGWNEASAGGVTENDALQYWAGPTAETLRVINERGVKLLASRGSSAYLDMKYNSKTPIGLTWAAVGDFPLYYNWDPTTILTGNGPKLRDDQLIGVEGPMWAETIRGGKQAEFLAFPRVISHAEIGWTDQDKRDVNEFTDRMSAVGERLLVNGTNFYDGAAATWDWSAAGSPVEVAPGRELTLSVGSVAAPGTKASGDGSSITVDTVDDADGISRSTLTGALTATVNWGDGSAETPVSFRTDTERTSLSAGGLYSLRGTHSYAAAGTYSGTVTFSDGTETEFTATVVAGTLDPAEPVSEWDPATEPGMTVAPNVNADGRLPGELSGFEPGSYVEVKLGEVSLGTVRPEADGTFALSLPIPPTTLSGTYTVTATEGERTATAPVTVKSFAVALENRIDQESLSIESVSSEETTGEAAGAVNAIDGDPATFWHTKWQGVQTPYPHSIVIDLGADHDVTGFSYQQRAGQANGRMKDYEVYVSETPDGFGTTPVATGAFLDLSRDQVIEFDESAAGRYVKIVGLSALNGAAFGGAAEINIGGTPVAPEVPAPVIELELGEISAGESLELNISGLDPVGPITISLENAVAEGVVAKLLRAAPVVLAEGLRADETGRLVATVTIPADMDPGTYSLVVAQEGEGGALRATAPLVVAAAEEPGGDPDADADTGGTADAGADGGTADAGADGGTTDAGADGGTTDAGADGGTTDAGADGGTADAGADGDIADAGADGGTADAGAGADGDTADAGADGGTADAGADGSDAAADGGAAGASDSAGTADADGTAPGTADTAGASDAAGTADGAADGELPGGEPGAGADGAGTAGADGAGTAGADGAGAAGGTADADGGADGPAIPSTPGSGSAPGSGSGSGTGTTPTSGSTSGSLANTGGVAVGGFALAAAALMAAGGTLLIRRRCNANAAEEVSAEQ